MNERDLGDLRVLTSIKFLLFLVSFPRRGVGAFALFDFVLRSLCVLVFEYVISC